jgi:N-terminal domain of reverse transcriptase
MNIIIYDIDLSKKIINPHNCSNNFYLLFKLQKKIYNASRKCHLSLVHGLQKLLLSLQSIKCLAINIVNKTIVQNNTYIKSKKICSKKIDQEINKQILCWSLDSEWKPRIESNLLKNQNFLQKIKCLYKAQYKYQISYLVYQTIIISKFIHKKYLLTKLQSFSWINKQISSLLQTESNIECLYNSNKNIMDTSKCILLGLLHDILCIGFQWIIIRQTQADPNNYHLYLQLITTPINIIYVSQNINVLNIIKLILTKFLYNLGIYYYFNKKNIINCQINIDDIAFHCIFYKSIIRLEPAPSKQAIKKLIWLIKNILYFKNKFGKIRAKTNLLLKKAISKINLLVIEWYKYFFSMVPKLYLFKIAPVIDEIIYRWAKKKYKTHQIHLIQLKSI